MGHFKAANNTGLHEHFIEGLLVQQALCREGKCMFALHNCLCKKVFGCW